MTTYDKNGWQGNKNPGKLNTSMWETAKKKEDNKPKPLQDKNGWSGTKNPGKLNTSMWSNAFDKKNDNDDNKEKEPPKKLDIYNEATPTEPTQTSPAIQSAAEDTANTANTANTEENTEENTAENPAESPAENPTESPAESPADPAENKQDMMSIRGACQQSGCKCDQFIENTSKWSKGKCNSCNHSSTNHKEEWVKKSSVKAQRTSLIPDSSKNELLKKSTKSIKKQCKARKLSVEGGKLDCIERILLDENERSPVVEVIEEDEDLNVENVDDTFYDEIKKWMEENENNFNPEFNDKLKEAASKYFEFDANSILAAKYILHFLKKRIGFDFTDCTGGHRWALQYVFVKLFDVQVVNKWGYYIRCRDVQNVENT